MRNHPGVFIVLEGSDGSGKGTQFRLLSERLKAVGHEVAVFDFPRYGEPSSHFVKRYLNGDYGPASEVSPYTASVFYALDRYEASPHIKEAIDGGKVVLANRYVGSNMAHQGTKFTSEAQQRGFFMWAESLEYQLLGIPRPDLNLFLKVPAEISFELIAKKADRNYTDKKRDEHEADIQHIKKAVETYDLLCKLFPKDFIEIDCTRDGQMLTIVEINNMIWESLRPVLPEPKRVGKGTVLRLDQPMDSVSPGSVLKPSRTNPELARETNKSKKESDINIESILNLQKQMLAKSSLLDAKKRLRLEAAINLLTPLHYRKRELKKLLNEKKLPKNSSGDEPMPVNEIINQLPWSIPAAASGERIILLKANPWNEFRLLDEAQTINLNYHQKEQALTGKLKSSAFNPTYCFEATSDYPTLLTFKNEVSARNIEISAASPRLGYTVPGVIERAGYEELFNKAFELSSKFYSQMTAARDKDAVYALLLGHNVRWRFEVDASSLSEAMITSKNQNLLIFLDLLRQKIAEHHPHVARFLGDDQSSATH